MDESEDGEFVDGGYVCFFVMIRKKRKRMRRESGFKDGLVIRGVDIWLRCGGVLW